MIQSDTLCVLSVCINNKIFSIPYVLFWGRGVILDLDKYIFP